MQFYSVSHGYSHLFLVVIISNIGIRNLSVCCFGSFTTGGRTKHYGKTCHLKKFEKIDHRLKKLEPKATKD
jgi:hypothetical protein